MNGLEKNVFDELGSNIFDLIVRGRNIAIEKNLNVENGLIVTEVDNLECY